MSLLARPLAGACGSELCEARIVALLFDRDDRGRVDPCPRCLAAVGLALRHWEDDWRRCRRSAHSVIVGRL